MHLAERLLKAIRTQALIKAGDRVAAAVSGGADSVALLLLLLELGKDLGIVLSVAHINHQLRGEESDADQSFVADLCNSRGLELHSWSRPLDDPKKSGIEAAARELRYACFRKLAQASPGLKIATGHTLDDQAETVLLRILRGTGIRGLTGIHPRLVLEHQGRTLGEVVRPLLGFRRAELQEFLRQEGQSWREDKTNQDVRFLRNRVRHAVLPVLHETFGPATVENLADLAEIARAEEEHWEVSHSEIRTLSNRVDIPTLLSLPLASQRRLLRNWIRMQSPEAGTSFRMIEEVLDLVQSARGRILEIGPGNQIRSTRDALLFETRGDRRGTDQYEYSLPIPGEVAIPVLGVRFCATIMKSDEVPEPERASLLDPDRIPPVLAVRNWRAGDRFWPAYTKAPRKVKELLSDRHVTGLDRKLWPVAVAGQELVWMRGCAAAVQFRVQSSSGRAAWIREQKLV